MHLSYANILNIYLLSLTNLVPRAFHLPTPKGARDERPGNEVVYEPLNLFVNMW